MLINLEEVSCVSKVFVSLRPKEEKKGAYAKDDGFPEFTSNKLFTLVYLKEHLKLHYVNTDNLPALYKDFVLWIENNNYNPVSTEEDVENKVIHAHSIATKWKNEFKVTELDGKCFFYFLVMENFLIFDAMEEASKAFEVFVNDEKRLKQNGAYTEMYSLLISDSEKVTKVNNMLVSKFFSEHPNNHLNMLSATSSKTFEYRSNCLLIPKCEHESVNDRYVKEKAFVLLHLQEVANIITFLQNTNGDEEDQEECPCPACENKRNFIQNIYNYFHTSVESVHNNLFAISMSVLRQRYSAENIISFSVKQCEEELFYLKRKIDLPAVKDNSEGYIAYLKTLYRTIYEHKMRLESLIAQ